MGPRFQPAAITPLGIGDVITAAMSSGDNVADFESSLAKYFSRQGAYTFTSLMRTMYACYTGLRQNSDRSTVVLPRYCCPSFIHGALAAGLEIEYCDVEPQTLAIDVDSLVGINLDNVLALVCSNLFGMTSEIDRIVGICRPAGVSVVEGVDYGVGTEYRNRKIGTWGDVAILNFQEGKALPVGGGAVVSDLDAYQSLYGGDRHKASSNILTMLAFSVVSRPAMYAVFMSLSGLMKINRKRFSMEDTIRRTRSETDFSFNSDNYELSISDFQGALGEILFNRLDVDAGVRRSNAARLEDITGQYSYLTAVRPLDGVSNIHYIRYPVLVESPLRNQLLKAMLNRGIEASPMYVEHGMEVDPVCYPGSYRVAEELLTIPCHPYMTEDDFRVVDDVLAEFTGDY